MESIYRYCQGESHKSSDKLCQDCAYSESSDSLSMAIVCDGHGGERYFRSKYGSDIAVEVTKKAIKSFVDEIEASTTVSEMSTIFTNAPFTSYSLQNAQEKQTKREAHIRLKWLFSHIISKWNEAITKHAQENDLDEWEREHVEQKYKDEFLEKRTKNDSTYEKTYGCTLMAYVQTRNYWFAFHIGDGKLVTLHLKGDGVEFRQPVPWDNCCFLNKTTSLCDSEALEEFRYCYEGDGNFPIAVFLGSDGLDDSYGDGDNLYNFYLQLMKIIMSKGKEKADIELKKSLPVISQRGSKDDISVACVYDETAHISKFYRLTDYQMAKLTEQFNAIESKILLLENKIEGYGNPENLDNSDRINLGYAQKDLEHAKEQARRIQKRQSTLKGEITKFRNRILEEKENLSLNEEEDSLGIIEFENNKY